MTAGIAYKLEMFSFILPLVYVAAAGHAPQRLPSRPVHLRGDAEDVADSDLWRPSVRHAEPRAKHTAPALRDAIRTGRRASRRKMVHDGMHTAIRPQAHDGGGGHHKKHELDKPSVDGTALLEEKVNSKAARAADAEWRAAEATLARTVADEEAARRATDAAAERKRVAEEKASEAARRKAELDAVQESQQRVRNQHRITVMDDGRAVQQNTTSVGLSSISTAPISLGNGQAPIVIQIQMPGVGGSVGGGSDQLSQDHKMEELSRAEYDNALNVLVYSRKSMSPQQQLEAYGNLYAAGQQVTATTATALEDAANTVSTDANNVKGEMPDFERALRRILACKDDMAQMQQSYNAAIAAVEQLQVSNADEASIQAAVETTRAREAALDNLKTQNCTQRLIESFRVVKDELNEQTQTLIQSFQLMANEKIDDPTLAEEAVRNQAANTVQSVINNVAAGTTTTEATTAGATPAPAPSPAPAVTTTTGG